ncbi:MAG: hypothetical protein WD689_02465 [Gaiellaceae bacterium]
MTPPEPDTLPEEPDINPPEPEPDYSGGAEPHTVQRLTDRFRDPRQRPGLAALFRTEADELDELVEPCYRQHLEYDHHRFWGGLPAIFLLPDGSEA